VNREEYLRNKLIRIQHNLIPGQEDIITDGITRDEYLVSQLERVNSEVPPCPGALTTPFPKTVYFGLMVECTACGFTVEVVS
jgi:hypothetical protein